MLFKYPNLIVSLKRSFKIGILITSSMQAIYLSTIAVTKYILLAFAFILLKGLQLLRLI